MSVDIPIYLDPEGQESLDSDSASLWQSEVSASQKQGPGVLKDALWFGGFVAGKHERTNIQTELISGPSPHVMCTGQYLRHLTLSNIPGSETGNVFLA